MDVINVIEYVSSCVFATLLMDSQLRSISDVVIILSEVIFCCYIQNAWCLFITMNFSCSHFAASSAGCGQNAAKCIF